MIAEMIIFIGWVCISPKHEVIALSDLFGNDVKREVRKHFAYKTNYYVEVSE